MIGNIYTSERCGCGGRLQHDQNIDGFRCVECDSQLIPKSMKVAFGRKITKRFNNHRYDMARQFLGGLRFKHYEGSLDARDYKKAMPLSLYNQSTKWLKTKEGLSSGYYRNLERWIETAIDAWGRDTNVKNIEYAHIEDLILAQDVSGKTKHDMVACYRQFFAWIERRDKKFKAPDMPDVKYSLGWRQIIDLETQGKIIDEIERICPNRRIWAGIKWLATYAAIRPGEMWQLRERDININGCFVLPPEITKEDQLKMVPMDPEDIAIYESFPTGLPNLPFFRRHSGKGVVKPGEHISKKAFYRWWKKACENIGTEGVDLYGGTRHTAVSAMGEYFSPEEIKNHATQHRTNKAFERYFQHENEPKRAIYEKINQLRKGVDVGQRSANKDVSN